MRLATFPNIPEKKLAQALRYQAGEYFPINLAQLIFDYSVVETRTDAKQMEVLMVASRRDQVETFLKTLQGARLQPSVIDVTYLSLLRTLSETQVEETVVLADIANGLSSIQVVSQGIPRFSRVISHSLQTYAREYQLPLLESVLLTQPQVAVEQEETLPTFAGFTREDWFSSLSNEIRSSVSYYLAQSNARTVDNVVLAGRGALLPGIKERLQEDLGVTVQILDPLQNLSKSLKVATLELTGIRPDFAVSIGLALRGLGA